MCEPCGVYIHIYRQGKEVLRHSTNAARLEDVQHWCGKHCECGWESLAWLVPQEKKWQKQEQLIRAILPAGFPTDFAESRQGRLQIVIM